jgi:hypothetical protein
MSAWSKYIGSLVAGFMASIGFYFIARANGYDVIVSTAFAMLFAILFVLVGIYSVIYTSSKH